MRAEGVSPRTSIARPAGESKTVEGACFVTTRGHRYRTGTGPGTGAGTALRHSYGPHKPKAF